VNLVIHDEVSQVVVAAHAMYEVIAADAVAVAVAARGDDLQAVIAQLNAAGNSHRAPMERVHAVGVDEAGEVRGAADAADDNDFVRLKPQFSQRQLQRREDTEVAATGTPVGVDLPLEILGSGSCAW